MDTAVTSGVLTAADRNLASKLQKLPNAFIFYKAIRKTDIYWYMSFFPITKKPKGKCADDNS